MTRLEMLEELRSIFEHCAVMVNDENWDKYDMSPDAAVDHRCVMAELEKRIKEEQAKS